MRIWPPAAAALASCLLCGSAATADTVRLRNGSSIEGIIVDETPDRVRVRLPFGEIELTRVVIESVVREESSFAEFLAKRDELVGREAGASDWVGLGRWAWLEGLNHSAKEAAATAAALDPSADGLAQLMAALGFVFDQTSSRWMSSDEYMERSGFVLIDGQWVHPSELAEQRADLRQAELLAEHERRQTQLSQALEYLAIAQLIQVEENRRLRDERLAYGGLPIYADVPVAVLPGGWHGISSRGWSQYKALRHSRFGSLHSTSHSRGHPVARSEHQRAILSRQTGSFIPVQPSRHNHGGVAKAGHPNPSARLPTPSQ